MTFGSELVVKWHEGCFIILHGHVRDVIGKGLWVVFHSAFCDGEDNVIIFSFLYL